MKARELMERLTGAERVYGEPYEKDGVTVIPAASIRSAGGFGTGNAKDNSGEGGGGAITGRPVGAYVVKNGEVKWEPAVDVGRIVLGGQILAGLLLLVILRVLRRRGGH